MRRAFYLLIAFLGTTLAQQVASAASASEAEASSVMNEYCQALVRGDIDTLKLLVGGDYLMEKEQLFSDAAYGDFLRNRYAGSRCEVIESKAMQDGSDRVEASVSIYMSSDDIVSTRFILGRESGSAQLRVLEEMAE